MTIAVESPHAEPRPAIPLSAADQASIDAYLGAGERAAACLTLPGRCASD